MKRVAKNMIAGILGTAALCLTAPAHAQTVVGIGSTKSGAVSQITATISKVVSENAAGIQMRKQTMGGTQQYIPVVNAGELAFGISNIAQYHMAQQGTGLSKGTKYSNLRLIATMMQFNLSFIVPNKLKITKVSELKGKRIAFGFKAAPLFHNITAGSLATGDLSFDDVKKVPAVGLVQHWRMMMEGKIDAAVIAAGTGFGKQINAKIDGGIRHISFPNTPESLKKMHKFFPRSEWATVQPRKGLTGVVEPTTVIGYDYLIWTHKGMADETVYKITKVMHAKTKELKEGGPLWRTYSDGPRLCKNHGYDYHPGSVKYFKEVGLWDKCHKGS